MTVFYTRHVVALRLDHGRVVEHLCEVGATPIRLIPRDVRILDRLMKHEGTDGNLIQKSNLVKVTHNGNLTTADVST